jgi:molybdate transport repressor ModE-like protein
MARLTAEIGWRTEGPRGVRLDPRLLDLLRALEHESTLRAAAQHLNLSYRGAWGMLLESAAAAGAPLVELQRGRGARLTRFGASLLRNDARMREAALPLVERFAVAPQTGAAAASPLRLVASHDPLLAEFCERFARPAGLVGSVSFQGSEQALAHYARGGADLAGFHVEDGGHASALRRFFKPRDRLIRFAGREQGLIVAPGNPKKLASLADVVRRHARFVNRQKGSGTRSLVDRRLGEARLPSERLRGYGTEEYTHLAVAATIASQRADAGIGVRAAAAQLGLDFVPLIHERYWLLLSASSLAAPASQRLLEALAGKPLSRLARGMPGYDLRGAGEVVSMDEAGL